MEKGKGLTPCPAKRTAQEVMIHAAEHGRHSCETAKYGMEAVLEAIEATFFQGCV